MRGFEPQKKNGARKDAVSGSKVIFVYCLVRRIGLSRAGLRQ
jgi:hypothetical protein